MSDSESSALSSPPASEDEKKLAPIFLKAKGSKPTKKVKKIVLAPPEPPSPPRPKRSPSPAHEDVLADNPDIAFIVMFRSRFSASFPAKLPHFGPQDIERGVVDTAPSPQIEDLLCAILALALNRKKPIERGHHGRALEEAISSNKHQWPKTWHGSNLVAGSKTFNDLDPAGRLTLLKTLIIWSLTSSDEISKSIKESYKQTRHDDDQNQPLSVQPWGVDDDKRKYWLIEGQDDTNFRVYREGNRQLKTIHWRTVAGSIDEVKVLAEHLETKHHTQAARRLASRIHAAIPRFEATEEKRRRREYRQIRRAQFARPQPGFSLYEGRTRGKRARYNFEDDDDGDDFDSDAPSIRRSGRNHSDNSTPVDAGPTVTASGRTVRPRGGGMYGESLLSGQASGDAGSYAASEASDQVNGRATRSGRASNGNSNMDGSRKRKHMDTYGSDDDLSDEDSAQESGDHWDGGDDFEDEKDDGVDSADDDDMSVEEEDDLIDTSPRSLIVKLKVGKRLSDGADSAIAAPTPQPLLTAKQEPPTAVTESQEVHTAAPHPEPAPLSAFSSAPIQELPKPEPMEIDAAPAPPAHPIAFELPEDEKTSVPLSGQGPLALAPVHGHPPPLFGVGAPTGTAFTGLPPPQAAHNAHAVPAPQQAHVQANGWN